MSFASVVSAGAFAASGESSTRQPLIVGARKSLTSNLAAGCFVVEFRRGKAKHLAESTRWCGAVRVALRCCDGICFEHGERAGAAVHGEDYGRGDVQQRLDQRESGTARVLDDVVRLLRAGSAAGRQSGQG